MTARKHDRIQVDSLTWGTVATVSRGVAYLDLDDTSPQSNAWNSRLPVMLSQLELMDLHPRLNVTTWKVVL